MAEGGKKRRDNLADQLGSTVFTATPLPPFITSIEDFIWCCFRVDPVRAAAALPKGFRLKEPATAMLAIYRHGPGWGLSQSSGGFLSLVIDDHDSPDTSEACFHLAGLMAEPDAGLLRRHYAPFQEGQSSFEQSGDILRHTLTSPAGLAVQVESRLTDAPMSIQTSLDRYVSMDAGGQFNSYLVSSTGRCFACELLSVTLGPAAPAAWAGLEPTELCWSMFLPYMLTNFSAPEPLVRDTVPRAASQASLLATLERLGRAACILSREGRVLQRNAAAAGLLAGVGVAFGMAGNEAGAPMQVRRGGGMPPLLAQPMPMGEALAGDGEVLVLLFDPEARERRSPRLEVLQLLGLTLSEARVAALVGAGLAPREAAAQLGLTEATVRSALKLVFGKLGVTRQAELVRLVAWLDAG